VWLAVLAATRMVSAASVSAAAVVGVLIVLPLSHIPVEIRVLGVAMCAFVIFAHRSNLRRIMDGTESRFGDRKRAGDAGAEAAR
jgi:glycerol-3-phosphate acyltransferase PlsY